MTAVSMFPVRPKTALLCKQTIYNCISDMQASSLSILDIGYHCQH